MPQRTFVSILDDDGRHVQSLIQSMPRSFKMHVWAAYMQIDGVATTHLEYIGTIQPVDQSDSAEIEALVWSLWKNERDSQRS